MIRVGEAITWDVEHTSTDGQLLEIRGRRDTYRLRLPLLGDFQGSNAATAVGAVEALADAGYAIDRHAIIAGLESVEWPGRMEVLAREPTLVVDGAHNDHSVATLLATLDTYVPHRNLIVVAGILPGQAGGRDGRTAGAAGAPRDRHPLAASSLHATAGNRRAVP